MTIYLKTIAGFGLLADNIEDGVDQFGSLGVVTLGPVVSSARLTEDKVVRTEDLAKGARANDFVIKMSPMTS